MNNTASSSSAAVTATASCSLANLNLVAMISTGLTMLYFVATSMMF